LRWVDTGMEMVSKRVAASRAGASLSSQNRSARMILTPNHNVWRLIQANRAAVLIDGAEYFSAVRSAMIKAEHSILIAGTDEKARF
jgi:phospholipase D1/2